SPSEAPSKERKMEAAGPAARLLTEPGRMGRTFEAARERGPRQMTVIRRKTGTRPGLQGPRTRIACAGSARDTRVGTGAVQSSRCHVREERLRSTMKPTAILMLILGATPALAQDDLPARLKKRVESELSQALEETR